MLVLAGGVLLAGVAIHNGLVRLQNASENAWSDDLGGGGFSGGGGGSW